MLTISTSTSGASAADAVLGFVFLAALIAAYLAYNSYKRRGFRSRQITTGLQAEQLRGLFESTVAGKGWSIVDPGNPMIAQSGLLAGIRQQIALQIDENSGHTVARIAVLRYSRKVFGGTTKAHTLRWRMNSFIAAVQRLDASASISG
jgi:hypothetical protein